MNEQEIQTAIWLYAAGFAGMFAHFLVKGLKGELPQQYARSRWRKFTCSLAAYLFRDYPRRTAAAVIATFAACTALVTTGQIDSVGMFKVAAFAFTAGYGLDSAINKVDPS